RRHPPLAAVPDSALPRRARARARGRRVRARRARGAAVALLRNELHGLARGRLPRGSRDRRGPRPAGREGLAAGLFVARLVLGRAGARVRLLGKLLVLRELVLVLLARLLVLLGLLELFLVGLLDHLVVDGGLRPRLEDERRVDELEVGHLGRVARARP